MEAQDKLDELAINTIRTLSIDAIQKANSGHPGTVMDAASTVCCWAASVQPWLGLSAAVMVGVPAAVSL